MLVTTSSHVVQLSLADEFTLMSSNVKQLYYLPKFGLAATKQSMISISDTN